MLMGQLKMLIGQLEMLMSALHRFLKLKSFSPNFSFKHFFRFSAPVHSTALKIEKNVKFFISKIFDFWRRCTARRQKSEKLPSFTAKIPPHSEIPEKIQTEKSIEIRR